MLLLLSNLPDLPDPEPAWPCPTPLRCCLQISLIRNLPGPGTTFVLAGFLKILTMTSLMSTAPNGAVRTAIGEHRARGDK